MLRASRVDDPAAQASHLEQADEHLADAREQLEEAIEVTSPVSLRERLSRLPWKRMVLTALALFVVSLVLITAFELVAGRSVSSITGGSDSGDTTIEQVGGALRRRRPGPSRPANGIHQPERDGGGVRAADPERFPVGDSAAIARRLDGTHRVAHDDSLGDTRADFGTDDDALT